MRNCLTEHQAKMIRYITQLVIMILGRYGMDLGMCCNHCETIL